MTASPKSRLDLLLVDRGLIPSRERARALILAGRVLVAEQKIDKPGVSVPADAPIRLLGEDLPYVSRGGLKLAAALEHWHIDVRNRSCLDIGASTGGFTDCLLQRGAAHVIAVDTGFGQMAMKLRNDHHVHLLERTNARYLEPDSLRPASISHQHGRIRAGQGIGHELSQLTHSPTFLVMDVSFISATLLLEPVFAAAPDLIEAVILVKPQFEAGRRHVGKGGIVRDPAAHQLAIDKVVDCIRSLGWHVVETISSPIAGAEGNKEFLLYARRDQ
ncbi:MAG TPA: TlyA family RNA methyltransferase [Terracidiphilus sp.]|nr:TlyA family RNA methyltransferase [Terracidiphilus sp.]